MSVSKGKYRKPLVALIVVIIIGILGYFVIYPKAVDYLNDKENKRAAQRVINLIDSLEEKDINDETEDDLDKIKLEYHALNKEQKKLVSNYGKLEKAYMKVEEAKNKRVVEALMAEIDKIDSNNLTVTDTSVKALREKYDNLSDEQKKLVTNKDKLAKYEKAIQNKKTEEEANIAEEEAEKAQVQQEQEQQSEILEMFNNLTSYDGLWNTFGSQTNQYQGMVESAINNAVSISDYFDEGESPYLQIDKVVSNDDVLANGPTATNQLYRIHFEGINPNQTGPFRTLEGTVSSFDGQNLAFEETAYY